MELSPETEAVLGQKRRMPPGRSMLGGGTELYRGTLRGALKAVAAVDPIDRDLLYLYLGGRDRALLWDEIWPMLKRGDLVG